MRKTSFLPFLFFWFLQVLRLLAFLWPSFVVSPMMVLAIDLLLDFCGFVLILTLH
jgi:hypothetical protein